MKMVDKFDKKAIQNHKEKKEVETTIGVNLNEARSETARDKRDQNNYKQELREAKIDNLVNIWNSYGKIVVIATVLIILSCMIAFYVYPTYIQDHPVESIDVEVPSEMSAGVEYSYPVTIIPSNASVKELTIDTNNDSIESWMERGRLYIRIGDLVTDGEKVIISMQSNKYPDSYKEISFIVKNDLAMGIESASTSISVGETTTVTALFNKPIDATITWTCSNSNVRMESNGISVDLYAPYEGWEQESTDVTITGTIPGTSFSKSIIITILADFQMSFKTAPTTDLNLGDSYSLEVNIPEGYDADSLRWVLIGSNASLSKSVGSSNTLVISTDAQLGDSLKVEVHSQSFGTITKTFRIDDVIHLRTTEQFDALMKHSDANFELMNNIDLGTILPIGDSGSGIYSSFNGRLNGNGHTISYQYSSKAHLDNGIGYVGLFAQLKNAGIYHLSIDAAISLGNSSDRYKTVCAGGLAGSASGSEISDLKCKISIRSPGKDVDYLVGGLIGKCCDSTVMIDSCTLNLDISVTGGTVHSGGIFGRNVNTTIDVKNTVITGSIYAKGGLAGGQGSAGGVGGCANDGTTTRITDCSVSGCSTKSADGGFGGNHKTGEWVARCLGSAKVVY